MEPNRTPTIIVDGPLFQSIAQWEGKPGRLKFEEGSGNA